MSDSILRIDTGHLDVPDEQNISSSRRRARTLSNAVLPALRISSAPNVEKAPSSPQRLTSLATSHGSNKARNESRKLVAHLLNQLHNRPKPPPLLRALETSGRSRSSSGIGSVVQSMKGNKNKNGHQDKYANRPLVTGDASDSDSDDEKEFTTDTTFDLMSQLKDVLLIANLQSWDIFYDSVDSSQKKRGSADRASSFLGRRSGQRDSRSRSRSPSSRGAVQAPELLSQCISILYSIVTEDCRFQISSPKPSRPPNALQAVTLDVAQFLIHAHRHDPKILSQIGSALIPAFMTFKREMYARLLAFFEEGVIGGMLEDIRRIQGSIEVQASPADVSYGYNSESNPPMVSIMIDEVHEEQSTDRISSLDDSGWRRWSSASATVGTRSTNAPAQDITIYHLSSLIPPLFAAILESIDLTSLDLPMLHRFHRIFGRLTDRKPDAYLDILAIIAYHTPVARYSAISLLLSYWSKSVGHVVITKPFPTISYWETLAHADRLQKTKRIHDHPYTHQFIPWRFRPSSTSALFESTSLNECGSCSDVIDGFGLMCPFCMCSVHFDCYDYPEGSHLTQYTMISDTEMQKVAVHRFCHVSPSKRNMAPVLIHKQQHAFRHVNIFSLALCFVCHKPLWGCVMQGLRCGSCKQFVHSSCLDEASTSDLPRCPSVLVDSSHMTIDWSVMRHSFADHYRDLFTTDAELFRKTYEEVSIFFAVLWTQLQIFENGIALGSVVIQQQSPTMAKEKTRIDEFELHYLVRLYETCLKSDRISPSTALMDHLLDNNMPPQDLALFFDWGTLTYMASVIKVDPRDPNMAVGMSANLLNVGRTDPFTDDATDPSYPYEVVSIAHMRDQLGNEFHIFSEAAARYTLAHLGHLGFFQPVESELDMFDKSTNFEQQRCCFPIPLGLEVSTDVETLVSAIEACLLDLDLSVNEVGYLLLIRRFWPDGMLSDYAVRRLSKAVLVWILSEDDNLAIMLRDYVARGHKLPGVRSGAETQPWPPDAQARPSPTASTNNGGDYVAIRRALLRRYASQWMFALHERAMNEYATVIYDVLTEYAEERTYNDNLLLQSKSTTSEFNRTGAVADEILRLILKLCQSSVIFTAFDDLFEKWLELTDVARIEQRAIPSLLRLFSRDAEGSQRSSIIDSRMTMAGTSALANVDPIRVLMKDVTRSKEGLAQGLRWLCLIAQSGVDIPVTIFNQFTSLVQQFDMSIIDGSSLVKAVLLSVYLRPLGRQELQHVMSKLHSQYQAKILESFRNRSDLQVILRFIRQSLAACLILYGCETNTLKNAGMIDDQEILNLPHKRKLNPRATQLSDPVIVDTKLIDILRSYVESQVVDASVLVAKFLNAFVNDAKFVESHEVDNFILRNGRTLYTCVWHFYGVQLAVISTIRTNLLLRVLVVDTHPLHAVMENLFIAENNWELRLQSALRLFRMILDVTSPAFNVDDRQWRSSVVEIFSRFFSTMWTDPREEIRQAVDTWSLTLLPAHFDAISACWDESFSKAPITERVKLTSFLVQLHPHFPHWRVMSWGTIIEALLEYDFHSDDEDDPASAHLALYGISQDQSHKGKEVDPELSLLQTSLITLSLQMIADGVSIDTFSILRIKDHLPRVIGFKDVSIVPAASGHTFYVRFSDLDTIREWSYPCLDELMSVLDSPKQYDVAPSAIGGPYVDDDTTSSLLVGAVFVDIILEIFVSTEAEHLASLPFITLKDLLKSLIIIIYKHDLDSRPLRHLQVNLRKAVRRTLDLLLQNISYDIREVVLSVCQGFIKRWPTIVGNFLWESIEYAAKLMILLNFNRNGDNILVFRARNFLETTLSVFCASGVFHHLCKRTLSLEFFDVIRYVVELHAKNSPYPTVNGTLRDVLLRDTLERATDNDADSLQSVINNLNTYVEVVHHIGYSQELMQVVGLSLTGIARRVADWPAKAFDPNPLLLLSCTLVQHNKAQSRELLMYTETLLRVAISRFHVSAASITRLLSVTTTLYRRVENPDAANLIAVTVLDLLSDGLRRKAHIHPETLEALIEALSTTNESGDMIFMRPDVLSRLVEDGLSYLRVEGQSDTASQGTLAAFQAVTHLVLRVPTALSRLARAGLSVRGWNMLLLAALAADAPGDPRELFTIFPAFVLAYRSALMAPQQEDAADVSRACVAIKLWLLLADGADTRTRMVWNELWPSFEGVALALARNADAQGNISALASSVWTGIADVILFLHQTRSVLALETASHMRLLNELRAVASWESKFARVLRGLTEPPPEVPLAFFVSAARAEVRAEERLQAAQEALEGTKGRRVAS